MKVGRLFLAIVAVLLSGQRAIAQRTTGMLEVGSARMRFVDNLEATALSLTPSFRVTGEHASFTGTGTFSHLDGASSNSGTVGGTLSRGRGLFAAEVEGVAGGSLHSDGGRTGQMLALGRLHVASDARGVWGGAGIGQTWDGAWRRVTQADVGAWLARQDTELSVGLSPTTVDDTIRYTDTFIAGRHNIARWQLDGSLGFRIGSQVPSLPADRTKWGSVRATYWATDRFGLTASAGAYPVDFTQGFPGGQFVSLSVRLRSGASSALRSRQPIESQPAGIQSFEFESVPAGGYRLRVLAPSASSVEIAGDFTQWVAVSLRRDGSGWWLTTLPIAHGTHEINVRMNGGSWQVPPGVTPLTDEFGGRVGLLVIPP